MTKSSAQPATVPYSDEEALKRLGNLSINQLQEIYMRITGSRDGTLNANSVDGLSKDVLLAAVTYGADVPEIGLRVMGPWNNRLLSLETQ